MNARGLLPLLFGLLLGACDQAPPAGSEGFAGLGATAAGYAQVVPGQPLVFPRDHGAHGDYRIEWWYVTANLEDAEGHSYGVQWTLFRNALQVPGQLTGWSEPTLWMGHAALTSEHGHHYAQALARGGVGTAGVEAEPLKAWIDDWQFHALSSANQGLGDMQMTARGSDFAYRLNLRSERPLVLQGDHGYSLKSGKGQASWYYSQPYFQVSGSLQVDGREVRVKGQAWLDREWSSQPLAADQSGWDWFSLHLADGAKVMLFQVRQTDGQRYRAGTWISADGQAQALRGDEIILTPGRIAEVAGRRLPVEWRLEIPGKQLRIDTRPLRDDAWMGTAFPYWEGPISFTGSQKGVGYLEMTGY
ncbi:lipocalin-like domain-containing protein [Pseudomonas gingeri]